MPDHSETRERFHDDGHGDVRVSGSPLASTRFFLAKALSDDGDAPARAITLAEQARDAYRQLGDADALAETEAWLAEHPPRDR